ncbi:MAG: DUF4340 domain-containing protein [Nitrospiraceae bacterium]
MSRYRGSIALALLLAGLGAYLYFVELPSQQREEETEAQKSKLLSFDEKAITGLGIKSAQGTIDLKTDDSRNWLMTAPVQAEADAREAQSMIRALVLGKVSRVIEATQESLRPFGLEHPPVTVTVRTQDQQETFGIGDVGPLSSTLYVLRESDKQVLLTDLAVKDFLNKTVMTFRRKEILPFEHAQADRLRLTYPPTEIVLYLMDDKPAKKWKIRAPIEANADQSEVRSFLFRLEALKAIGIIDPGPERVEIAKMLKKPLAQITVHAAGADHTVKLYHSETNSGEAFAETSAAGPLYRISPAMLKDLTKDLFTLQDKRLLGLDFEMVAMLAVKTRTEQYQLINQSGQWVLEDRPEEKLNQETVDLFVSRVVNLPAEIRVVKQPGSLAPYGLVAPTAEFTATGKDGSQSGRLVLGNQSSGLVYAIGQAMPGVFQARADILTQIPEKLSLIKPVEPSEKKP